MAVSAYGFHTSWPGPGPDQPNPPQPTPPPPSRPGMPLLLLASPGLGFFGARVDVDGWKAKVLAKSVCHARMFAPTNHPQNNLYTKNSCIA